jgi:glucose 1-dehydrogenase
MTTSGTKKIAVVTGSSKGIGRAIVLAFARSIEYKGIVTNSREIEEAQQVSEEIRSLGYDSIAVEADISKESDCIRLMQETMKHYGRIDVLVNNAGIQGESPLEETSTEMWKKILEADLTGPFVCVREAVKCMVNNQNPKGGCIINISSVHKKILKPLYIPYSTSKAGLEMMSKTMALELAGDTIRVNIVAPGAIETDMNKELEEDKRELKKVLKRIPLGRVGKPEEVAYTVLGRQGAIIINNNTTRSPL